MNTNIVVFLPTYNEKENLPLVTERLFSLGLDLSILVVDAALELLARHVLFPERDDLATYTCVPAALLGSTEADFLLLGDRAKAFRLVAKAGDQSGPEPRPAEPRKH